MEEVDSASIDLWTICRIVKLTRVFWITFRIGIPYNLGHYFYNWRTKPHFWGLESIIFVLILFLEIFFCNFSITQNFQIWVSSDFCEYKLKICIFFELVKLSP